MRSAAGGTMWKWMAGLVLALLLVTMGLWHAGRSRCFVLIGDVTCRVDTDRKLVALSFDDGPTPQGVAAVLPVLRAHGARATFFLIGQEMAARPGLAGQIVAEGHEIGNHSYSHRRMMGLFPDGYVEEIARTEALLRREGATGPILFRPPFGKKLTGLPVAVRHAGEHMVTWDVEDPTGEAAADAQAYARHMVDRVRPGSILLIHPMYAGGETARAALPIILAELTRRGYRVVSISELIGQAG
jgi:peptidoglycan/xylan/chitin deacetylase (PgdA/CDA1 family)